MMRRESAKIVKNNLELISIQKQNAALSHAEKNSVRKVKISNIQYIGKEDVFNMEVANHHNFAVNGGFIVHNCIDASRYAFSEDMKAPRVAVTSSKSKYGIR